MFVMPIHDPHKPLAQCIDEDLELAVLCEELGFDDFWVGEHHSSSVENIVMPEIFLAKVLGLTQRIRIGPAPVCLQYHHPAHVAGRLAFLDHLSRGRLNVCFGPGAIPTDMEMFGAEPKDSGARVSEAIDMPYHKGKNVDPSDELPTGEKFANVDEFKQLLLKDKPQLARALATRLISYSTGRAPQATDRDAVEAIVERSAAKNYGFRSLIHEIVESELFRNK